MKHASPATVSRGGVLYINEGDVGRKPYLESWRGRLDAVAQRAFSPLFAHDFESNVEQMRIQFLFASPILDISFVQSMTCLLKAIPDGLMALDCGVKTMEIDIEAIRASKALIGNGPTGDFVMAEFEIGTTGLMDDVFAAASAGAISVIGRQGQQ